MLKVFLSPRREIYLNFMRLRIAIERLLAELDFVIRTIEENINISSVAGHSKPKTIIL
jgi:hypothetical protein